MNKYVSFPAVLLHDILNEKDHFLFVLLDFSLIHGDCATYDQALIPDAPHTLRERQKTTWKVLSSLKLSTQHMTTKNIHCQHCL